MGTESQKADLVTKGWLENVGIPKFRDISIHANFLSLLNSNCSWTRKAALGFLFFFISYFNQFLKISLQEILESYLEK